MDLQRIVIGVDFSPASADAARWAAQHFAHDVELILAHTVSVSKASPVVSGGDGKHDVVLQTPVENATERLQDLAGSLSVERIRFEVREGEAAGSLTEVATECNADLLVVGARGERAGLDRALGTTAQHAVRKAAIPVMVVPRSDNRPISQILVAVEDEASASESLRWAAMLSDRFNARVTTLHIATAGALSHSPARAAPPANDLRSNAQPGSNDGSVTDRWTELAHASGIARERVTSEEVSGVPAVEILSASERNAANILIMGRRAARDLRRAVLGSVTATVLSNPPCSVLVVPVA